MFCLTFQAFVQLLWNDRSYMRMMHSHWNLRFISVSSRQNTWPMLPTFSIAIHNDEYCIVLIAIKLNSQWCLLTVEYGRCTATWNLESKYFLARFIKLSYTRHPSSNAWSEAMNDAVPALRVIIIINAGSQSGCISMHGWSGTATWKIHCSISSTQ